MHGGSLRHCFSWLLFDRNPYIYCIYIYIYIQKRFLKKTIPKIIIPEITNKTMDHTFTNISQKEDAEERDDGGELEERKNYAIVEEKLKEEIRRNIFLKNQYEDLSIQVKFFQQIVDGLKNKK